MVMCAVGYGYRLLGFPVTGVLGFLSSGVGSKHIIFFLEGVMLAICYEKGWLKQIGKRVYFLLFFTLMLFYVWLMTNTYSQVYSILISPCVFVGVLLMNNYIRKESWWNKALSFCGDISFSIYLVHILIIRIIMNKYRNRKPVCCDSPVIAFYDNDFCRYLSIGREKIHQFSQAVG